MDSLQNEVALVPAGSAGIGLAAGRELAEGDAQVFVTGRRPAEVEAAVAAIGILMAAAACGGGGSESDTETGFVFLKATPSEEGVTTQSEVLDMLGERTHDSEDASGAVLQCWIGSLQETERTTMTTSKTAGELLRAYLAEIQDPAAAAALFADDGVIELPSIGARAQGPADIERVIGGLLEKVPDFRFQNIRIWIETPDQAFGEYDVEALVVTTGKLYRQSYAGRLVAEGGKIKLLRESLDTLAAARAFARD